MVSIDVHIQTHWAENSPVTTILYDSSIYEVYNRLTVVVINLLLPHGSTKLAVDCGRTGPSKRKVGRFKCWSVWSLVSRALLKAGVRGSKHLINVDRNWNMGYCAILMLLKRTRDVFPLQVRNEGKTVPQIYLILVFTWPCLSTLICVFIQLPVMNTCVSFPMGTWGGSSETRWFQISRRSPIVTEIITKHLFSK